MSDESGSSGSPNDKKAIDTFPLTDDERWLLTWYREMTERDRRYIHRVAEVLAASSG